MGGANVGPSSWNTVCPLEGLVEKERALRGKSSGLMEALRKAVIASKRWERWRTPEEKDLALGPDLSRTARAGSCAPAAATSGPRRRWWPRGSGSAPISKPPENRVKRPSPAAVADSILHYYRAFGLVGTPHTSRMR